MDPVTGLIFVIAVLWSCREGGRAVSRSVGTRRTAAAHRATARGGTHDAAARKRRAARQATIGFWAGETRRGFPDTRHGFAQGWREHRLALAQRERDTAGHKADTEGLIARLRAETAAHLHRLQVAQRQTSQPPTMSQQLRAQPVRGAAGTQAQTFRQPLGDPITGPPLADGKTKGNERPDQNGRQQQPGPATNGGPVSDFNYDKTKETAEGLQSLADHTVNLELLDQAVVMADEIGGQVPTDQTTNGLAGDVASAARKIQEGFKELSDSSAALHKRVEDVYGPQQEARDSGGEELANEYVTH
jgi:hypothetical protein